MGYAEICDIKLHEAIKVVVKNGISLPKDASKY